MQIACEFCFALYNLPSPLLGQLTVTLTRGFCALSTVHILVVNKPEWSSQVVCFSYLSHL
jgi:hypothetical protein